MFNRKYFKFYFTFVLLIGCTEAENTIEKSFKNSVQVIAPVRNHWPQTLHTYGSVEPWQFLKITSQVSGEPISELYSEVGEFVTKGQLLAKIDDENAKINVLKAEAALEESKAQLTLESAQYERYLQLSQKKSLSQNQLLQAEIAVKKARAQLKSSEASLASANLALRRTNIKASDDGLIISREGSVGDSVSSGFVLFSLIRKNRLEWRAQVNAEDISKIQNGQEARLYIDKETMTSGKVRLVSKSISGQSLQTSAYVDLHSAPNLHAGMYIEGDIILGQKSVVALPESAVFFRDGFKYVMTLDDKNSVHQKLVETGDRREGLVEIISDISLNDKIVLEGGSFLQHGEMVKVISSNGYEIK